MRNGREEPLKGVGTSSRGLVCWLVGCAGPWLRCGDQGRRGVVTGTLIKNLYLLFLSSKYLGRWTIGYWVVAVGCAPRIHPSISAPSSWVSFR